jgi:hypothetical protein
VLALQVDLNEKAPISGGFAEPSDGLEPSTPSLPWRWCPQALESASAASVLQASTFRSDVTVFRLNAAAVGQSGLEPAFLRNTAARVYTIEAAHNPEVAGSNPAPATQKGPGIGAFRFGCPRPNALPFKRGLSFQSDALKMQQEGNLVSSSGIALGVCRPR